MTDLERYRDEIDEIDSPNPPLKQTPINVSEEVAK